MTPTNMRMTGAVLRELGITERRLNYVLSLRPELAPAVVAGRRIWTRKNVDALRAEIEARKPRAR